MRDICDNEKARTNLEKAIETDPVLYLRVFEAGYGRPPQALKIGGDPEAPLVIRQITLEDGTPLPAPVEVIPDTPGDEQGT